MTKGFSIITNFGCDKDCWYCIWKRHPLQNCSQPTNWDHLERSMSHFTGHRNLKKISVSGGGDPLCNIEEHEDWWKKLFALCNKLDLGVDVHTSMFPISDEFLSPFRKYVLHLEAERFKEIKEDLKGFPIPLRLTFVMTKELWKNEAEQIVQFACEEDIEVSFRQLFIPKKDNPVNPLKNWWKKAEAKFPNHKVRFVKQVDYNTYYMPDNLMYSDFMCKLLPMEMADDPIMDREDG